MIVMIRTNGVSLELHDDMDRFSVDAAGRDSGTVDSELRRANAGYVENGSAVIAQAWVLANVPAMSVDDAWRRRYSSMIAYADGRGWLAEDGGIRAHLVCADVGTGD